MSESNEKTSTSFMEQWVVVYVTVNRLTEEAYIAGSDEEQNALYEKCQPVVDAAYELIRETNRTLPSYLSPDEYQVPQWELCESPLMDSHNGFMCWDFQFHSEQRLSNDIYNELRECVAKAVAQAAQAQGTTAEVIDLELSIAERLNTTRSLGVAPLEAGPSTR